MAKGRFDLGNLREIRARLNYYSKVALEYLNQEKADPVLAEFYAMSAARYGILILALTEGR